MLLYYITDRAQFPGSERERQERLLGNIAEAARCGVDYVQLREKDLSARDLEALARSVIERIRASASLTRLLINSRTDIALAVEADGVHLRSNDISPQEVRRIWRGAGGAGEPIVAVSCHTDSEAAVAQKSGADFIVFGPVFGKKGVPGTGVDGLELLRRVSGSNVPVFALGGVSPENAGPCADAGAKGLAGIRLFQENPIAATVTKLRG